MTTDYLGPLLFSNSSREPYIRGHTHLADSLLPPHLLLYLEKEMATHSSILFFFFSIQYYCLENSMDREAWPVTVHRVAKSWTRLSDFHYSCISPGPHWKQRAHSKGCYSIEIFPIKIFL